MTYSINSGSDIPGVNSSWQMMKKRDNVDGQLTFTNMAINTWRLRKMSVDNFLTYKGLEGNSIDSLETNNPEDRDAFVQFTSVIMSLIEGQHVGLNMENVTVQFFVDLNSEV